MGSNKAFYLIFGVFMFICALIGNVPFLLQGKFPEVLIVFSMSIMGFCLAYLAPHFAKKDERAQKIRERAIYISYFWGLSFAVILMIVVNPSFGITLAGFHVLSIFMTFYISTVFLNMVYYARKY